MLGVFSTVNVFVSTLLAEWVIALWPVIGIDGLASINLRGDKLNTL